MRIWVVIDEGEAWNHIESFPSVRVAIAFAESLAATGRVCVWQGDESGIDQDVQPIAAFVNGRRVSAEPRQNPAFGPSEYGDIPNPPSNVQHLLTEFHSREPAGAVRLEEAFPNLELPEVLQPRGYAYKIFYHSDKKDPGDPEDKVGIPKDFVHLFESYEQHHDKKVIVYSASGANCDIDVEPLEFDWPEWVVYLGETPGWIEAPSDDDKNLREVKCKSNAILACSPDDGRVLFAIKKNGDIFVFAGGNLVTNWRGIVG